MKKINNAMDKMGGLVIAAPVIIVYVLFRIFSNLTILVRFIWYHLTFTDYRMTKLINLIKEDEREIVSVFVGYEITANQFWSMGFGFFSVFLAKVNYFKALKKFLRYKKHEEIRTRLEKENERTE